MDAIEATSIEVLGIYLRKVDEALTTAFGTRGKTRLNRVFDVIGFVYLDYNFSVPGKGHKRKGSLKSPSAVPKRKMVKIWVSWSKSYYENRVAVLPAVTP